MVIIFGKYNFGVDNDFVFLLLSIFSAASNASTTTTTTIVMNKTPKITINQSIWMKVKVSNDVNDYESNLCV